MQLAGASPETCVFEPKPESPSISIVVPLHNEASTLSELYQKIRTTMESQKKPWELVFVNDGSTDDTPSLLDDLHGSDRRVSVVHLRRNYGQTAALMAGFNNSAGEVIVAMDGDMQHNPEEIPGFLEKLEQGYDLVSGCRSNRSDAFLTRTIPSRVANWLMAKISRVDVHDFGTTFKAYRREVLNDLRLYGDLHRFVPALLALNGARITEIPITDLGRNNGKSHYGFSRTFRVMFDLLTVGFLMRYMTRPLHFFGKIFLACSGLSFAIGSFLAFGKIFEGTSIFVQHGPLALLAVALMLSGIQFLGIGLIGELVIRTYFESQNKTIYAVKKILRR